MTSLRSRPWPRRLILAGLAGATLLLSGCIYLRLLELKRQLHEFDRYFAADTRDGLKLTLKTPVLLDEDMAFFQLVPESKERIGVAERWHFGWVKDYPVPGEDPAAFGVNADFTFVDHKLARVALPERFFAIMPKGLFLALLRAVGEAKVDTAKRTATSDYHEEGQAAAAPSVPTGPELAVRLGRAMETKDSPAGELWRYRYRKASPDQKSGRIDVTFTLNPETKKIRHIHGRVFDANLDFNLDDPPAVPAKTPPP